MAGKTALLLLSAVSCACAIKEIHTRTEYCDWKDCTLATDGLAFVGRHVDVPNRRLAPDEDSFDILVPELESRCKKVIYVRILACTCSTNKAPNITIAPDHKSATIQRVEGDYGNVDIVSMPWCEQSGVVTY